MEKRKLITICLFFLCIAGTTFADDPNDCNSDFSELGEIASHWVEDYSPQIPNEPPGCVKTLYLDGDLVDSNADSPTGLESLGCHLTIGAAGDLTFIYNEYIGSIDEFALYAGLLDAATIQAHYDAKDSNSVYYAIV